MESDRKVREQRIRKQTYGMLVDWVLELQDDLVVLKAENKRLMADTESPRDEPGAKGDD